MSFLFFLLACSSSSHSPPTVRVMVDYAEIEAIWYPDTALVK
jgi:hypothetical protein